LNTQQNGFFNKLKIEIFDLPSCFEFTLKGLSLAFVIKDYGTRVGCQVFRPPLCIGNEIIFGSQYKHNDNATPIGMHNAFMNSFTSFGL
jgi:hypothetical protein